MTDLLGANSKYTLSYTTGLQAVYNDEGLEGYSLGESITSWPNTAAGGSLGDGDGSASSPTLSFLNGKKVASFTGGQFFSVADMSGWAAGSMFTVLANVNATPVTNQEGPWYLGGGNQARFPNAADGQLADNFGRTSRLDAIINMATVVKTSPMLYSVRSASGDWSARINRNGSLSYSTGTSTVAFPATGFIGKSAGSPVWEGVICETLLFDTKVPDEGRDQIESYLAGKWGVP